MDVPEDGPERVTVTPAIGAPPDKTVPVIDQVNSPLLPHPDNDSNRLIIENRIKNVPERLIRFAL
jgi:hypothetical protein